MNILFASVLSLGLLSGFLLFMIALITYVGGTSSIDLGYAIVMVILINLFVWLIGPMFQDFLQKLLYNVKWLAFEEFEKERPMNAQLIRDICEKYGITLPKIGIIPDNNPTAFTYGSGPWNGRIVISQGLFTYCNEQESAAVIAHEIGHIKHWDVAIMTLASTIIQIIYTIYRYAEEVARSSKKKGKQIAMIIAVTAYIFYTIGNYVLLFLSRAREYYADQFAAEHADANALASALVKIAYGILQHKDENKLISGTQHLGLVGNAQVNSTMYAYDPETDLIDRNTLGSVLLYDLYNPWAKFYEFFSTHPLTGKRIKQLMTYSTSPVIDFDYLYMNHPYDKTRMNRVMKKDMMTLFPALFVFISMIGIGINAGIFNSPIEQILPIILGGVLVVYGLLQISLQLWKFSDSSIEHVTIFELMKNPYVSPLHGDKVKLDGEIIGKGTPGYVFSEDVMLKDKTGLMYINYHGMFGFLSNLIFSLTKVKKLIGEHVVSTGWFFRGQRSYMVLDSMERSSGSTINGYSKIWAMIGPILLLAAGVIVLSSFAA